MDIIVCLKEEVKGEGFYLPQGHSAWWMLADFLIIMLCHCSVSMKTY